MGTCENIPKEVCEDVTNTVCNTVMETVCKDEPRTDCNPVDREECSIVTQTDCQDVTEEVCEKAPKKVCKLEKKIIEVEETEEVCRSVTTQPPTKTTAKAIPVVDGYLPPPEEEDINNVVDLRTVRKPRKNRWKGKKAKKTTQRKPKRWGK